MTSELLKSILTPKASKYLDNEQYSEFFKEIAKSLDYEKVYYDSGVFENFEKAGIDFLSKLDKVLIGLFNGCNLTKIELPENIKTIENFAFNGCINLSKIEIEQGVKTINDSAFLDCKKLNNVYLPDSITLVNNRAFCRCSSLIEISVGKNTQFGTEVFSASPTYKISFRGTVKECKKVLGQDHIWSSRTKSKIITCIDGKYKWERKT